MSGITNLTNLVVEKDLTVGDDLTVVGDIVQGSTTLSKIVVAETTVDAAAGGTATETDIVTVPADSI